MENIFKNIEEKVAGEIDEVRQEKEKKLQELGKEHKENLEKKRQEELRQLKQEAEREISELKEKKRKEFQFKVGSKKREILSEIYKKIQQKISQEEEKLEEFVKNRLPSKMEEEITAGEKTSGILKNHISGDVKISDDLEEEGFIIKGADKDLDYRISEALNEIKQEIEPELTKILFSKE